MTDGRQRDSEQASRSRIVRYAQERAASASPRGHEWGDHQDSASFRGVGIDAWRRYRAVDGPPQSALLALYSSALIPGRIALLTLFSPGRRMYSPIG